jgi:hypothetical protein
VVVLLNTRWFSLSFAMVFLWQKLHHPDTISHEAILQQAIPTMQYVVAGMAGTTIQPACPVNGEEPRPER